MAGMNMLISVIVFYLLYLSWSSPDSMCLSTPVGIFQVYLIFHTTDIVWNVRNKRCPPQSTSQIVSQSLRIWMVTGCFQGRSHLRQMSLRAAHFLHLSSYFHYVSGVNKDFNAVHMKHSSCEGAFRITAVQHSGWHFWNLYDFTLK